MALGGPEHKLNDESSMDSNSRDSAASDREYFYFNLNL